MPKPLGDLLPPYLAIAAAELGKGQPVTVQVRPDAAAVGRALAEAMFQAILERAAEPQGATLIVPVGPVEPFPLLAEMLNHRGVSCRTTVFINMDEYLTDAGDWLPRVHPLSFRGFMDREFYARLDPALAPPPAHRVFPDPHDCAGIGALIAARGGVDLCCGGLGINGHLAFNEPPEPGVSLSPSEFAALPTRVLDLSRETRTINSVTVGGELSVIPHRAVTVGMKEILAARRLRFGCNRPWQSGVVRRALHGPLTPACPASFLRTHPDASLTVTPVVAAPPDPHLREPMQLTFRSERVLAVVAHPDDAELLCAGTLARAQHEGAVTGVCVLCRGDKGRSRRPVPRLAAVRRQEMKASARVLRAALFLGEHPDATLQDTSAARKKLVEVYRQFHPTLILAHAPQDYHPDHRAAAALAEAASWFCASRGCRTASAALPAPPALWWMDTVGMTGFDPAFFVDITPYAETKARALACHQSQLRRAADADFGALTDLQRLQTQARGLQAGVPAAEAFRPSRDFKRARAW